MKIAFWTPKIEGRRPLVSLQWSIPTFSKDLVFIPFGFKMSNIRLEQRTSDCECGRQVILPFLQEKEVEKWENFHQLITWLAPKLECSVEPSVVLKVLETVLTRAALAGRNPTFWVHFPTQEARTRNNAFEANTWIHYSPGLQHCSSSIEPFTSDDPAWNNFQRSSILMRRVLLKRELMTSNFLDYSFMMLVHTHLQNILLKICFKFWNGGHCWKPMIWNSKNYKI